MKREACLAAASPAASPAEARQVAHKHKSKYKKGIQTTKSKANPHKYECKLLPESIKSSANHKLSMVIYQYVKEAQFYMHVSREDCLLLLLRIAAVLVQGLQAQSIFTLSRFKTGTEIHLTFKFLSFTPQFNFHSIIFRWWIRVSSFISSTQ